MSLTEVNNVAMCMQAQQGYEFLNNEKYELMRTLRKIGTTMSFNCSHDKVLQLQLIYPTCDPHPHTLTSILYCTPHISMTYIPNQMISTICITQPANPTSMSVHTCHMHICPCRVHKSSPNKQKCNLHYVSVVV